MAGDDEARARAVLAEMQLRISQGPTCALGIGEVVTPEEVRAAFLALTKQFHPARFGRLSPDVQKLANEVFLGIKAAHDHMLKVLGSSPASARGGRSAGIPIATTGADGTSRTSTSSARGTQSIPRLDRNDGTPPPTQFARGTDRDARASSPVLGGRPATPAMGVPVGAGGQRHPTGSIPVSGQRHPTGSIPVQPRPVTPVPPGTQPGIGPGVGPNATQPLPTSGHIRQPTPSAGTQPITPVPPGTQPGVAPSASQRMVRVRTSTGATFNVPASQAGATRPPTLKPGEATSPLKPITLRPGEATSPLKPQTLKPGEATSPLKPITLRPGEATSPLAPPTQPPGGFNPPTVRNVAPPPAAQPTTQSLPRTEGRFDEGAAFREAAALMEQKNWSAAREALHNLAAKVPQNKTYRAWLCYARGREAYIAGRPDDAIAEMQRALQLAPDLAHARHALTELQKRR